MQVSPEEFADWREQPVTEYIFGLMAKWAAHQKTAWADLAWAKGEADPALLLEARVRADCYNELAASTLEDWQAIEEKLNDSEA